MYMVISPAKKMHDKVTLVSKPTLPSLLEDSKELVKEAKGKNTTDLQKLMGISERLASLNVQRFQNFTTPFTEENAKPAIHFFAGDTYVGLDAASMNAEDIDYAQQHLGILSGLYGLLRPKDLMQAYRLEMGTKMSNKRGKNLYEFWGSKITAQINQYLATHDEKIVLNLASNEYFSSIQSSELKGQVITPIFKEERNGKLKIISFSAKRARGTMARYVIKNRITKAEEIKKFAEDGYLFKEHLSDDSNWVFVR